MPSIPWLIAFALATWRVSSLLVYEDGPANVFARVRQRVGAGADEVRSGSIADLFSCVWCMSIWVAGVLYLIRLPALMYVLAASTIAIVLERKLRYIDK